jgi:hypothetical protein
MDALEVAPLVADIRDHDERVAAGAHACVVSPEAVAIRLGECCGCLAPRDRSDARCLVGAAPVVIDTMIATGVVAAKICCALIAEAPGVVCQGWSEDVEREHIFSECCGLMVAAIG